MTAAQKKALRKAHDEILMIDNAEIRTAYPDLSKPTIVAVTEEPLDGFYSVLIAQEYVNNSDAEAYLLGWDKAILRKPMRIAESVFIEDGYEEGSILSDMVIQILEDTKPFYTRRDKSPQQAKVNPKTGTVVTHNGKAVYRDYRMSYRKGFEGHKLLVSDKAGIEAVTQPVEDDL